MTSATPRGTPSAKPTKAASLTPAALVKILVTAGARHVHKRAKAVLFSQGDRSDAIYYIVHGRVERTVISEQGKEGTIAICAKGDFVGEASLTQQPVYLDCAVAVSDCDLLALHSHEMRAVLAKNGRASTYFTNFLLQRTLDVQADLIDHLFNSSEKRLARVLLLLANFGHEGRLEPITNVTHEMLAQRVGTTRARISFFMNKFRRLGLIEYNGEIRVHSGLLNVVLHNSRLAE